MHSFLRPIRRALRLVATAGCVLWLFSRSLRAVLRWSSGVVASQANKKLLDPKLQGARARALDERIEAMRRSAAVLALCLVEGLRPVGGPASEARTARTSRRKPASARSSRTTPPSSAAATPRRSCLPRPKDGGRSAARPSRRRRTLEGNSPSSCAIRKRWTTAELLQDLVSTTSARAAGSSPC